MSRPKRPDHAITIEAKVAFYECDPLFVVWHGRYFEWLDVARTTLLASVGLDVPDIRGLGYRMFVVDARCRYLAPLSFGDTARITAWFGEVAPLIRVSYDVYDAGTDRWSARATTKLATTDAAGVLLPRTPDAILERLPHP